MWLRSASVYTAAVTESMEIKNGDENWPEGCAAVVISI